jgi:predicted ATPase
MPISSLRFVNFKVLRDATLPLGRTTLIIGPNGSGKTTALYAFQMIANSLRKQGVPSVADVASVGTANDVSVHVEVNWDDGKFPYKLDVRNNEPAIPRFIRRVEDEEPRRRSLANTQIFSFESDRIAEPVPLTRTLRLESNGKGLAAVLTTLQDQYPERFEELNKDLYRWLPEFNRILLDTPRPNQRAFWLRTSTGSHQIPANRLSQGTLLAIALLTLCHLPEPPALIGIEDPDRGLHPRLMRDLLDAIHRLSNPEEFGDTRNPVQVILTTHSPYFVDLFKDNLNDIVIADKTDLSATFRRLSEIPNIEDIVRDSQLGESWFTGVLGGVPANT